MRATVTGTFMEDEKDPFSLAVIGQYPRTVTIELPVDMKVIGKREDCGDYRESLGDMVNCSLNAYDYIHKNHCPCHSWRKKARGE